MCYICCSCFINTSATISGMHSIESSGIGTPVYENYIWSLPGQSLSSIGLAVVPVEHGPAFRRPCRRASRAWACILFPRSIALALALPRSVALAFHTEVCFAMTALAEQRIPSSANNSYDSVNDSVHDSHFSIQSMTPASRSSG